MKIKKFILTLFTLCFLSVLSIYSQENVPVADSSKQKKTEVTALNKNQKQMRNQERNKVQGEGTAQQAKAQGQPEGQAIKQVKSARPDMSKAKGARPPEIVRPSGAPKGIGRPGGAVRRGGRF